jgi:phospholipase C
VFHVYDRLHLERIPRRYTVEARHSMTDRWEVAEDRYDLWILGPNGFVREFSANRGAMTVDVALTYLVAERAIELRLDNPNEKAINCSLASMVYEPHVTRKIDVGAHGTSSVRWGVSATGNWYDLSLLAEQGFVRRFAGRMETGKNSASDPAMG